jgi:hypothetical protein
MPNRRDDQEVGGGRFVLVLLFVVQAFFWLKEKF